MHRILTMAVLAAALPMCAQAQTTPDCSAIENDLDRLSCYDLNSGRTARTVVETEKSAWSVRSEKSDFEDTTDVFLSVNSDEPVGCGYAGNRPITLFVRCTENTTAFIIATHCHVASGFNGYGQVEYRIDNQKTRKRNFDESTNNQSLGLWNGGTAIPVIKSMFGAEKLLVRFTPFNENPVSASFSISGIAEAIVPLRESCKW